MKRLAFVAITAFAGLAGLAAAQPFPPPVPKQPPLTPKPAIATVEAEVLLVGCSPLKVACGVIANRQQVAVKVTKVTKGPLKVGDTPVLDVLACFEGPLLHKPDATESFVELDQTQIRRGSKIQVELEIYRDGTLTTTDKISVLKL